MSHGTVAIPANMEAIETAYQRWRQDPDSVDPSWRYFFEGFELGMGRPAAAPEGAAHSAIVRFIYAYRDLGHFLAHLDPLGRAPRQPPASGTVRVRAHRSRPRPRRRHQPVPWPGAGPPARADRAPCARPTAGPSASNTCTSRTRASAAGCRNGWSPAATVPISTAPRKSASSRACTTPSFSSASCKRATAARNGSRSKAPRR